jgi:hypothetical protein
MLMYGRISYTSDGQLCILIPRPWEKVGEWGREGGTLGQIAPNTSSAQTAHEFTYPQAVGANYRGNLPWHTAYGKRRARGHWVNRILIKTEWVPHRLLCNFCGWQQHAVRVLWALANVLISLESILDRETLWLKHPWFSKENISS